MHYQISNTEGWLELHNICSKICALAKNPSSLLPVSSTADDNSRGTITEVMDELACNSEFVQTEVCMNTA